MSRSGAASGVAQPHLVVAALSLSLLLAGAALAAPVPIQGTPLVMVDSYEYALGDSITVRGSGLEPEGSYAVRLTSPGGEVVEENVTATRAGTLTATSTLDEAGAWTVELVGPRVDARLGVRVVARAADEPAPRQGAGQQGQGAEEPAPPGEQGAPDQDDEGQPERPQGAPPGQGAEEPRQGGAAGGQGGELPGEPVVPPAQARGEIDVALDGGDVVGSRNGVEAWRLAFGSGSGATAGLVEREETVLVGHGNHLLEVDRLTGSVLSRERLPAQVADVDEGPDGVVVTVRYSSGEEARVALPAARPVAFDPDPSLYTWLRAEAGVSDPVTQLARDPTNPWLYVAAARQRPDEAQTLRRGALAQARTFYEYAQLAQEFMAGPARDESLAAQAMNAALDDFVARGYRGSLLFEPDLVDAYGFPQVGLRQALTAGDREAADFWAPWVNRLAGDGAPGATALLNRYADMLQEAGEGEAAAAWRELAAATAGADPRTALERAAAAVGSTGWYGVLALLVAVVALRLTLLAKYWRAQTLTLRQRREAGRGTGRFARALTLRYATFTEKLVILLLFAAMVAVAALGGWTQRAEDVPDELGSGSLATPAAQALLGEAREGPDRDFALAYAAQTAGDDAAAGSLYRALTADPDAMNNLGVLRGEPELFRLALDLDPGHPEASFNLGEDTNPSRLLEAYRPDEPLLAAPDRDRLARAFGGSPWESLGEAFTNPYTVLVGLAPIETTWAWATVVVLFLAWAAWTFLTLFFPRPQAAANAPRTFLYHLLALLLPGSGLADELWGVLLLVPWAIFGIDTLRHLTGVGGVPALPYDTDLVALVLIYVVNTVAFAVEYASYSRRMRDLRVEHPELAAAYGLRP